MDPSRADRRHTYQLDDAFRHHEDWAEKKSAEMEERIAMLERQVEALIGSSARMGACSHEQWRLNRILIEWIRSIETDQFMAAAAIIRDGKGSRFLHRIAEIDVRLLRRGSRFRSPL